MNESILRLAVWSGPRNISTALMRAWGSRPDTFVCDEPFYAHYLKETPTDHPGVEEIIAHHETDWRKVVDWLLGPVPDGKRIFYQKQMNKHMLDHIDMGWIHQVTNCFLIREPKEMITSFIKVVPDPSIDEFGLIEQVEMFNELKQSTGKTPVVVDAKDVLMNPRRVLGLWCETLGIPFTDAMLQWEPGIHKTDGIWAEHWYSNVINSTGFGPYKQKNEEVPDSLKGLLEQCEALYETMYVHRLC